MSICVMRSYFQRDYNVPFLTSEQENMLSTSDYMSIGRGGGGKWYKPTYASSYGAL